MQVGVTITDTEGRIVYTNPADAEMHGWAVEDLIGQHARVFAPPTTGHRMSGEELRSAGRWVREGWNARRDGSLFPVRLLSDVVRDANGEPVGIVTTCEDIADRHRAEEALRESEGRYRAIFEQATHGICRIGADGRFTTANPALLSILEYESLDDLLVVDVAAQVYADPGQEAFLLERVGDNGRIGGADLEWRRSDGTLVAVRVAGRALWSENDRFDGFELIVENVSERRELEEQLRQAQKMEAVGQLTGGIAHDFNNILTVILANADLVAMNLPPSLADLRNDLVEIQDAARRGSAMVRQLLAFSRHEALTMRPVDLATVVAADVSVMRRLLPENISVTVSSEDSLPPARADEGAVEQILLNLATNARDAMPDGGMLRIETTRTWLDSDFRANHGWGEPGEYVAVTLSDTGIGMDEETRKRIFEPFFTTKPVGVGTGLGMAMVYGLMKQHGGFVNVYSEPGEGTTIKLLFPAAIGSSTGAAGTDSRGQPTPPGTETILLVEDEAPVRRAARRVLERYGYTVLTAADGIEALAEYAGHKDRIDIIVSDLVMPNLGGRELYRRIRESGSNVPFVFASGYTAKDVRETTRLDADVPFVHKPWTISDLLVRIRMALDT